LILKEFFSMLKNKAAQARARAVENPEKKRNDLAGFAHILWIRL